jgi:ABC-type lipoprotein export system ATPase subunit
MSFLEKLNKKGKTIIMVTHDPELAREHAKTVYLIRDGKIESHEKKVGGKWKKLK